MCGKHRNSDDLASLVDMTVERDVCDFLVESGCMELIVGSLSTCNDAAGRSNGIVAGSEIEKVIVFVSLSFIAIPAPILSSHPLQL